MNQINTFSNLIRLLAVISLSLTGCARAYHWYQSHCECIPYDYCPPAPLPYTPYCGCPTPVATCYQGRVEVMTPLPETTQQVNEQPAPQHPVVED